MKTSSIGEHYCSEEYVIAKDSFDCPFCPRKYKRKAYLVKHLRSQHGQTPDNKFEASQKQSLLNKLDDKVGGYTIDKEMLAKQQGV